ncbi:hypothetical protein EVAR_21280_1 [Eumeta japonica]|uniref:Uncharacterized protein n=1 Tax=Eumeta variegata TaxID=151549 RepID=A0A4C1WPA0_EUMVA|nr:hypothetical protein EVAR_21280_1 [Eumeta japonica]
MYSRCNVEWYRARSEVARLFAEGGLLAALSAKLSPRAPRRAAAPAPAPADGARTRGCHGSSGAAQAAFLDKLSATLQQQQQRRSLDSARATTVRDIINAHAKVRLSSVSYTRVGCDVDVLGEGSPNQIKDQTKKETVHSSMTYLNLS